MVGFRASYAPHPSAKDLTVPRNLSRTPRLRLLVQATVLCLYGLNAHAAKPAACLPGSDQCPRKSDDFSLCKPNALLAFYVPGLPTSGVREQAETDFSADRFQSADTTKYVLQGKARIQRLDQLIQSDELTYWTETTAWLATGNVRYQDSSMLLSASKAQGKTTPSTAVLDDARFQMLTSRGNGSAAQAELLDDEHAHMKMVRFSTCDPDQPSWEIRAKDLNIDQAEGIARGHDVTLRVGDVPVLWLPYARFPTDDRRQSGFLYPSFGFNGNSGLDFTLPYYFNLAENYDLTLFPRLVTQRGFMAGAEFRYLTDSSRGQIDGSWMSNDRRAERERGAWHWDNFTSISSNWNFTANINGVSDKRYFEDFGDSLSSVATSLLPSSAYLNGRGRGWSASIGGDKYQITDPTLSDQFEPYRRLPRATFEGDFGLLGSLRGGVKSEFVAFDKDCFTIDGTRTCPTTGQRLDLYPYLSLPMEGASWFLRPEFGVRHTRYDVQTELADGSRRKASPDRTTPISSLDMGLVFERDANLFGKSYTQTLEPRLFYLYVPYRNQDQLPLFDAQLLSFDFPQLFTTNRYTGADRQMDANNLTAAVTTRLLESATGTERLSASLGQIRYFDDQRVQLYGAPTRYSGSDYVAELDVHLNDRWRLRVADQWDPNNDRTDLSAISVQRKFLGDGVLNLSYRYRRDFLEQTDISALIPLNDKWRLIGRWNYSLRDRKPLETLFGVERDSCCVVWRLLARHYLRDASGEANDALYFEMELKGLGAIGQKTGDFLRRGILGYQ
ncbi:LPS-assembly protein [Tahibacter aquaticus]|uniref:LPS-assembly protein LptD n=1 Tax=Tahibacter aquaticus TaxID=520092 RepID=A0A4R6YQ44_9GAMM|nr:LPS-assembly protein [Tahibacter aquaticus]